MAAHPSPPRARPSARVSLFAMPRCTEGGTRGLMGFQSLNAMLLSLWAMGKAGGEERAHKLVPHGLWCPPPSPVPCMNGPVRGRRLSNAGCMARRGERPLRLPPPELILIDAMEPVRVCGASASTVCAVPIGRLPVGETPYDGEGWTALSLITHTHTHSLCTEYN